MIGIDTDARRSTCPTPEMVTSFIARPSPERLTAFQDSLRNLADQPDPEAIGPLLDFSLANQDHPQASYRQAASEIALCLFTSPLFLRDLQDFQRRFGFTREAFIVPGLAQELVQTIFYLGPGPHFDPHLLHGVPLEPLFAHQLEYSSITGRVRIAPHPKNPATADPALTSVMQYDPNQDTIKVIGTGDLRLRAKVTNYPTTEIGPHSGLVIISTKLHHVLTLRLLALAEVVNPNDYDDKRIMAILFRHRPAA